MSLLHRLQDKWAQRRVLTRWQHVSANVKQTALPEMRSHVTSARQMRQALDGVLAVGEDRLALPRIGSDVFHVPAGADWSWRPDVLRQPLAALGDARLPKRFELRQGVTVFHDCPMAEIGIRQVRNTRDDDLAPFGLRLDVFHFGGGFLSVACDLPSSVVDGLDAGHIVGAQVSLAMERPVSVHARLNIQYGPNTEQMQAAVEDGVVEFDLAYADLIGTPEKLWLDLIFEKPVMNQIRVNDLTIHRRPRAEL